MCLHKFAASQGWGSWPWHEMPLTAHLKEVGVELMHALRDLENDKFYVPPKYPGANDSRWVTHWPGEGPGKTFMGYGYFCPDGWRRFSIKLPDGIDPVRTFQDSVVMYHGLRPANVTKIVRNGFIPQECQHSCKAVYFTPSIAYAAHPRYARVVKTSDGFFQVALEVRVAKDIVKDKERYLVLSETLCAGDSKIDNNVPNARMEFAYKSRAKFVKAAEGIVVTGLMVRRCLVDPLSTDEAQWWLHWPLKSKVKAKKVVQDAQNGDSLSTKESAAAWLRTYYYV